jgi:hypothetical protein
VATFITLKLGDIKPNPFRPVWFTDEILILQIQEAMQRINATDAWRAKLCPIRKIGTTYQLSGGHTLLEAAKQQFGEDYEVSLQVENYTDLQMMMVLAYHHTGSVERQITIVRALREYLKQYPESCPLQTRHRHRLSADCVRAVVGKLNWDIEELFDMAKWQDAANAKDERRIARRLSTC